MKTFKGMAVAAAFALATALPDAHAVVADPVDAVLPADAAIAEAVVEIVTAAGSRRLVLLGEKHGTREIPRLVAALSDRLAADGPLLVGLEMPHAQQPLLRAYLRADDAGAAAARAALLTSAYWQVQGDQHDGRRSHDVLALLEHLRKLRAVGGDVAVLAYDVDPQSPRHSDDRDEQMAARLRTAYAALPRGRLLVLTGNVHAMTFRPADAPPQMPRPMGSYLRDLDPFSVDVVARDGAFWGCIDRQCEPRRESVWRQARTQVLDEDRWDLRIVLPQFTVARLVGAEGWD